MFDLKPSTSTNVYSIVSRVSGKCLDINEASLLDGAPVIQYPCTGGSNQSFLLRSTTLGLQLVAQHSNKCIMARDGLQGSGLVQGACTITTTDKRVYWSDSAAADTEPKQWLQVPIRTQAQASRGLRGGEGHQMLWGLTYAPSNPKIAYMLIDTSQVWKSTDGGASWHPKHVGFRANGGISIAVHPANENVVFVAASSHLGSDSPADGIYRTTDGGNQWTQVRVAAYRRSLGAAGTQFAFGKAAGTVYAGTHNQGLLKSTDSGASWVALNLLATTPIRDVISNPADASKLMVSTPSGLFAVTDSTSAAPTLKRLTGGLPQDSVSAVVFDPRNPSTLYASLPSAGVYKSTNNGSSFVAKNTGLLNRAVSYLAISPVDPLRLYVSVRSAGPQPNPFFSTNGGESWASPDDMDSGGLLTELNPASHQGLAWPVPIAPHPTDGRRALTSGGGTDHPSLTTDGGKTWTYSGTGYTGMATGYTSSAIGWDKYNPSRFALFCHDLGGYLTENGASTFRGLKVPPHMLWNVVAGAMAPEPNSKTLVVAVGTYSQQVLAVSRDNGSSWTQVLTDVAGNSTENNYNQGFIAFHPQNPNVVYARNFKSTDKGATWRKLARPVLALYGGNGSIVYSLDGGTVYKSTDGGANWFAPYGSFPVGQTLEMAVDPSNQNRLYVAGRDRGVFVFDGQRWTARSEQDGFQKDSFGNIVISLVTVDPRRPNVVYAGGFVSWWGHSTGVYMSTDYGIHWRNISYNLGPELNVDAISVNPHNSDLYMGSFHGTWRLPAP